MKCRVSFLYHFLIDIVSRMARILYLIITIKIEIQELKQKKDKLIYSRVRCKQRSVSSTGNMEDGSSSLSYTFNCALFLDPKKYVLRIIFFSLTFMLHNFLMIQCAEILILYLPMKT